MEKKDGVRKDTYWAEDIILPIEKKRSLVTEEQKEDDEKALCNIFKQAVMQ